MSTESACARAAAAAAAAATASMVEQRVAGALGADGDDRRMRLAAAKAAAAATAATAQQEAAAVAAAAALRRAMEQEDAVSAGSRSRSPERRRQSPSPERRRGHRGRLPAPQMVYRDSGAGAPWPMLTKSNYHEWSLLMKVKLEARHLWNAVHLGGVRYEDDHRVSRSTSRPPSPTRGRRSWRGTPSRCAESAVTGYAARHCSAFAGSGKASPFSPANMSRTSPCASAV